MKRAAMRDAAIVVGKLALAGATVFGIGFAIVTRDLDPQAPVAEMGHVAEAEADLIDGWGVDTEDVKFARAVSAMGMRPRAYDYNGNVVYFATGYADGETPMEAAHRFQEELVYYGVNARNHASDVALGTRFLATGGEFEDPAEAGHLFEAARPTARASLNGEVVPVEVRREYVSMSGLELAGGVDDVLAAYRSHGKTGSRPLRELMKGYRFFDATMEPESRRSMLTAVWTRDADFDPRRMEDATDDQSPPDPSIPPCMGCDRDFRFQSLNPGEPFAANKWTTGATPQQTYTFYRDQMEARGWRETGVQPYLDRIAQIVPKVAALQGRMLSMEKDGQSMSIALIPDGRGGTQVISQHQDEGAQSVGGVE